jgi:t-SNARE complex subunit (syntaxin)
MMVRIFNDHKEELKEINQSNSMNIKRTWTKNSRRTEKQLNEFREDFNKLQNETKETIKKKEVHKIKKTTQNMIEEF